MSNVLIFPYLGITSMWYPGAGGSSCKMPRQQAIHWGLTDNEVLTMWDFRKKRQTAEQQHRVESVLDAQEQEVTA